MSVVVIRIEIDDAKLHAYSDQLYGGPPEDPAPPNVGKVILGEWVDEIRGAVEQGDAIDSLWFDSSNDYVTAITVSIQE